MRTALLVGIVLGSLAGCKKHKEVDCGAAARAWVELAHRQLESDGDAERSAKANAVLPALREELVKRCRDDEWTLESRVCIAAAKTIDEVERCQPSATAAPAPVAVP